MRAHYNIFLDIYIIFILQTPQQLTAQRVFSAFDLVFTVIFSNIARLFGGRIVLIRYRSVPGHLLMQHLFARFVAGVKIYAVGLECDAACDKVAAAVTAVDISYKGPLIFFQSAIVIVPGEHD